jgi:uncharacterized membrane protein YphA (DoxX/SURF4 family)
MKKLIYLLASVLLLPSVASAHVKWFVESGEVTEKYHGSFDFYAWNSIEVAVWSLIVVLAILIFSLVDRRVPDPKVLVDFGAKHKAGINRIAQAILGLFLISVSFLWKIVIVPDMHVVGGFTLALQYLQVAIGLMYIFNFKPKLASIGLGLLCLGVTLSGGIVVLLENAMLLSLAAYFFIVNSKPGSYAASLKIGAVDIVRIGTGISLIVLAFTEKFLYPELSLQFLQVHNWNFMQPLFPWFTDQLFVLSTGFAEVIFGVLFIMGYMTRTTTVLISVFFASSVITMLVQFGQWEVEDLVVYAAAILFIFYGHGKKKFFTKNLSPVHAS